MIWYDYATKEPVAPGSCEDAGNPSIISYECPKCGHDGPPIFNSIKVDYKIEVIWGIGQCSSCHNVLLTSG